MGKDEKKKMTKEEKVSKKKAVDTEVKVAKKQKTEDVDMKVKKEKKQQVVEAAAPEEAPKKVKKEKKGKGDAAVASASKEEKKEKKGKGEAVAAPKKETEKAEAAVPKEEKKEKKDKKEKKAKKDKETPKEEEAPKKKEGKDEKKAVEGKKRKADEEAAAEAAPSKKMKEEPSAAAASTAAGSGTRVYVGNLPWQVSEEQLKETFADSGVISNIEWLMHQDSGKFRGAVFAEFASEAAAKAAVKKNGVELDGRAIKVEIAQPKKAPASGGAANAFDDNEPNESVFLGNLSWSVDEEAVRNIFSDCGEVARIKWLEKDGQFMGKAFIDFDSTESATKAVAKNGEDLLGRPMKLNFSKPRENKGWGDKGSANKSDKPQRSFTPAGPKPEGCLEIFCGNLSYTIDEDKISDFFKDCGVVTNTRWLNDRETQEFKGIGFVSFDKTEEVDKAVAKGGQYLDGRQIRIDYAGQKKKEGAWNKKW